MKVILSRKGFDSTAGGVASPILPDGTLLSLPIPAKMDTLSYADLHHMGVSYADILSQLKPKDKKIQNWHCHLDPDIRPNIRSYPVERWQAGFGQIDKAQTYLANQGVGLGDLFLFFGWFRQTEGDVREGTLRYVKGAPDLHVLYGYLQVGECVKDSTILQECYAFHPHSIEQRVKKASNMLYLPSETLSFNQNLPGYGTFDFSEKLVLTKPHRSRATWQKFEALLPDNICKNVKNSSKKDGLYYAGQWQELVLKENNLSMNWAMSLFQKH